MDIVTPLPGPGRFDPFDHGTHVGAAAIDFFEHRAGYADVARTDLTLKASLQDLPGVTGGFTLVDVRVGLVGQDDIGQLAHCSGHVGVQVESNCNRCVASRYRAQAPQQLALAIPAEIRDHGAMQTQQNAVISSRFGRCDNGICQPVEGRAGYLAARSGAGAEDVMDMPAMLAADIHKPGELGI